MLPRAAGRSVALALVAGVGLLTLVQAAAPAEDKGQPVLRALPLQESLRKARCEGKYEMLLYQLEAPADAARYGEFYDLGRSETATHVGRTDLPPGHWVYAYPFWYLWRNRTDARPPRINWGAEQATGEPDTPGAGDIVTAWASATPDGQDEWLMLEYAEPVVPVAVVVHETYNPGALARVTAFRLDGEEVEVWKGKDPTPVGAARGISEIKFTVGFKTNRVRIHIASTRVPGWNEIDAVGLRDTNGKTHWATAAAASSVYGVGAILVLPPAPGRKPAPLPPRLAPPRQ